MQLGHAQSSFVDYQKSFSRVARAFNNYEDQLKSQFISKGLEWPVKQLYIRSFKYNSELQVWVKNSQSDTFSHFKNYKICALAGTMGPKRMEGDYQVPEGFYYINEFNANSTYHLSLGLNYPNPSDKLLSDPMRPGGEIYIHGSCVTVGCIPLTDPMIEELYVLSTHAKAGGQNFIPVHIFSVKYDDKTSNEYLETLYQRDPSLKTFEHQLKKVYDFFMIKVSNLKKSYNTFQAVKGISFQVHEGEIFGLLGPNGAGKSTTLEIMETLREKTSGEITIGGFDLDKEPNEIKKIIGVQLQTSGFYPGLKLVELIKLFNGLYNKEVDPIALLKKVNLEDKAKSIYKSLSGGQKQRFSIATTLINDPRIIFLDEPTTGLDPQARRNLWDLIKNIRDAGTTVIITTHYMDEAEYLCDRVAIMDEGQIIALDKPDLLIDQLLATGFEKQKETKAANLEDVFIQLTGHGLRESS